jgi:hypothetical protein
MDLTNLQEFLGFKAIQTPSPLPKKTTCPAIECSRDAYVALVLWAHKER